VRHQRAYYSSNNLLSPKRCRHDRPCLIHYFIPRHFPLRPHIPQHSIRLHPPQAARIVTISPMTETRLASCLQTPLLTRARPSESGEPSFSCDSMSPSLGSDCCGGFVDCTDLADEEQDELQEDELGIPVSLVQTSGMRSTSNRTPPTIA
jgi:hypothetical protein